MLAWACFVPVALLRASVLAESDTFWQVRTGLLILGEERLPRSDPFSWTAHGNAWTINSWGFDVVLALAYRAWGLPGVALAGAVLVMLAAAGVLVLARRLGAHPVSAGCVLLLGSPVLIDWLSARPQLVDYVAVPLLLLLLRRIAEGGRPVGSILGVLALSVVWINLHAAAVLGIALAIGTSAALLARRRSRARGWWCLAGGGAALTGCLVNPYGIDALKHSFTVKDASVGVVQEWQPIDPADPTQVVMLLLGAAAWLIALRRREVTLITALTVLGIAGVLAIRFLPVLVVVALPVLAAAAAHPALRQYASSRRIVLIPGGMAGVAALLLLALPGLGHLGQPDPARYPVHALGQLPSGCRLFNSYAIGGYVLLQRPDVAVSMDSRNDLYGVHRVTANEHVVRGDRALANGFGAAGCVLVPPDSVLARQLVSDPGWRVAATEPAATLFIRR